MILRAGPRSRIARLLNREAVLGTKLSGKDYLTFVDNLFAFLADEGLVIPVSGDRQMEGWRLSPSAIRLVPGAAIRDDAAHGNPYFHDLYRRVASELAATDSALFGMEGREHTAQVTPGSESGGVAFPFRG